MRVADWLGLANDPFWFAFFAVLLILGLPKVLTEIGLNGLHIVSDEMTAFVAEFQRLKSSGDLSAATLKCTNLCYRTWNKKRKSRFRVNLVDLFLGIAEDDEAVQECKLGSIVVHNGVVTAPLGSLLLDEVSLERQDEDSVRVMEVFSQGQSVFLHALTDKTDMFTGQLLERAFAWGLSCRAAKQRQLIFGSKRCGFKCEEIQAGRVFDPNVTLNSELVNQLRKGVLYYADESKKSHPGADLWFKEENGALVLVEVGGTSSNDKARRKVRELSKTVSEQSRAYDIAAVVLLPNVGPDVMGDSDELLLPTVVAGEVAQRLLGGLAQLLTWLDTCPELRGGRNSASCDS